VKVGIKLYILDTMRLFRENTTCKVDDSSRKREEEEEGEEGEKLLVVVVSALAGLRPTPHLFRNETGGKRLHRGNAT
jgi:hypothetical protein